MANVDVVKIARILALLGGIIIFSFGFVGLIVAFASCKHGPCALASLASVWAIIVGLLIAGVESGKVNPGPLENNLARGIVWVILVIFPFFGAWYSWIGSILVFCAAILYIVGYATGYRSSKMFSEPTQTSSQTESMEDKAMPTTQTVPSQALTQNFVHEPTSEV